VDHRSGKIGSHERDFGHLRCIDHNLLPPYDFFSNERNSQAVLYWLAIINHHATFWTHLLLENIAYVNDRVGRDVDNNLRQGCHLRSK